MRRAALYVLGLVTGVAVAVTAAQGLVKRGAGRAPADTRPPVTRIVPAPGQSLVDGELEHLAADNAQAPPLRAPFTLANADRGSATIENALVGGERTTVYWGGGTPLTLDGDGALEVAGATVEVDGTGVTWRVAGARPLLPGRYRAGGPVAVGARGLAASQDAVEFVADERTVLNASAGVVVRLDSPALVVSGPGRVVARGRFTVSDGQGEHRASRVELGDGPYQLEVASRSRGLALDATLQGPVTLR